MEDLEDLEDLVSWVAAPTVDVAAAAQVGLAAAEAVGVVQALAVGSTALSSRLRSTQPSSRTQHGNYQPNGKAQSIRMRTPAVQNKSLATYCHYWTRCKRIRSSQFYTCTATHLWRRCSQAWLHREANKWAACEARSPPRRMSRYCYRLKMLDKSRQQHQGNQGCAPA